MKKEERFTRKNPDGKTYRMWLEIAETLRIEAQGGGVFVYGPAIDRLGKLEDSEEEKKTKK